MEVNINKDEVTRMKRTHRYKKKNRLIRIIIFLLIIALIVAIIVGIKNVLNNSSNNNPSINVPKKVINTLVGKWTTDGNTIYEFNDDGTGTLIVPVAKLKFSYTIDDKTLLIDFENEDSDDVTYVYELTDDKLTLNGKNGLFEFTRNIE